MRLDDLPTSDNVRDLGRGRGGGGFGGGGMGGMLGMILPLVGRRFGCLGIGVVLVLMVVFGGGLSLFGGGGGQQVAGSGSTAAPGATNDAATACNETPVRRATCQTMYSTEQVWGNLFQQSGERYRPATLNFYDGQNQSGCGAAMAAMGPFYCPTDQGVYIDTSFFDELANKYRAQGDFAQDYVVAHEVGHHIQALTGIADRVRQGAIARRDGGGQRVAGAHGAAGGLLRRRLGRARDRRPRPPRDRARRRRGRPDRRRRDRRRHVAARSGRAGLARKLHPRHERSSGCVG